MKQGYGKQDSDKIAKEIADKPLNGPGNDVAESALIGGVGNRKSGSSKDVSDKGQNRGSGTRTAQRETIPPYKEGGFRNRAMEHKRG